MSSISDKSIKHNRQHSKTVAIQVSEGMSFDLQIVPPKIVSQYIAINPNFSKCLLEKEQIEAEHQRNIDNWLIKGQIINTIVRGFFAFIIAMFGLWIAWNLGKSGNTVAASVIATIDLVGLARIFLGQTSFKFGRRRRPKNTEDK